MKIHAANSAASATICQCQRTPSIFACQFLFDRKNVTDTWPEEEFAETQVTCPGGETLTMCLATRETQITAAKAPPVPVLEVRRLDESGHQTAIITTARTLASPTIAGRMLSRWCQENDFAYMMQHYDIDGLVQYGSEEIPGTTRIVNPAWRQLDRQIRQLTTRLRRHQATLGAATPARSGRQPQSRPARRASRNHPKSPNREQSAQSKLPSQAEENRHPRPT